MNSKQFLKEGFLEDAQEAHSDHEVQMARVDCYYAAEHAIVLHKLLRNISEEQGLEGWVASKITLANDYLKSVREHLEYQMMNVDAGEDDFLPLAEGLKPVKKNSVVESTAPVAEDEEEKFQDFERGPWYVILKGKAVTVNGMPKKFNWLNGAKTYFRSMMDKNPEMAQKIKREYDEASDKKSVIYYTKNLPADNTTSTEQPVSESEKPGLWANIRAKRERIKGGSGERMRKPGSKGAPSDADIKSIRAASESVVKESDFHSQFAAMIDDMKKSGKLKTGDSSKSQAKYAPEQSREDLERRLRELESEFDPAYQYSDDYSFWTKQNAIAREIASIKKKLGSQGVTEGEFDQWGGEIKTPPANWKKGLKQPTSPAKLAKQKAVKRQQKQQGVKQQGVAEDNEQKYRVTYDMYFTNREKPLYTKTRTVRADSEEEAIKIIQDLIGGRNHRIEKVKEGEEEGSEIKIPTEDGIGWQDIRLIAGEGELTQKTIKQAIEIIRKRWLDIYQRKQRQGVKQRGVAEGYILKKTKVEKTFTPGDPDEYYTSGGADVTRKDTDYEIINNKTGQVVGTASWTTNDYFGPGALKITMKNGATRWLDIYPSERGNPQTAFNRFVKDPQTAKKYKEQGVAEGWKEKAAGATLGAAALGGIGAGIAYSPMAYVDGKQIHMAMPGKIPDHAKLVTDDNGKKIYVWKSYPIKKSPGNTDGRLVYRPAEDVKEGMAEGSLNEFAIDNDGRNDGGKFIPWNKFIEQLKQILAKDFDVNEKIIKDTIKANFIPHDPMEFGPTMLYSYYERRPGRNSGAFSTRGAIQVGEYFPGLRTGENKLLTAYSILRGHPFERHFDLTFDNIYKIANIIKGNTKGAYQMQSQGVEEGAGEQKYMAVYNKHIGNPSYIGKPITSGGKVIYVTASSKEEASSKFVEIFNRSQVLSSFIGKFVVVPKDVDSEKGVAEGSLNEFSSDSEDDGYYKEYLRGYKDGKGYPEVVKSSKKREIWMTVTPKNPPLTEPYMRGWYDGKYGPAPGKDLIDLNKLSEQGVAEGFPYDVDHMPGPRKSLADVNKTSKYVVATNAIGDAKEHRVTVNATSKNNAMNLALDHFEKKGLKARIDFDGLRLISGVTEGTDQKQLDQIVSKTDTVLQSSGMKRQGFDVVPDATQSGVRGSITPDALNMVKSNLARAKNISTTAGVKPSPDPVPLKQPWQVTNKDFGVNEKKVNETSAGSIAGVVNPKIKNKSKVGTLFGGTYKQQKDK